MNSQKEHGTWMSIFVILAGTATMMTMTTGQQPSQSLATTSYDESLTMGGGGEAAEGRNPAVWWSNITLCMSDWTCELLFYKPTTTVRHIMLFPAMILSTFSQTITHNLCFCLMSKNINVCITHASKEKGWDGFRKNVFRWRRPKNTPDMSCDNMFQKHVIACTDVICRQDIFCQLSEMI